MDIYNRVWDLILFFVIALFTGVTAYVQWRSLKLKIDLFLPQTSYKSGFWLDNDKFRTILHLYVQFNNRGATTSIEDATIYYKDKQISLLKQVIETHLINVLGITNESYFIKRNFRPGIFLEKGVNETCFVGVLNRILIEDLPLENPDKPPYEVILKLKFSDRKKPIEKIFNIDLINRKMKIIPTI